METDVSNIYRALINVNFFLRQLRELETASVPQFQRFPCLSVEIIPCNALDVEHELSCRIRIAFPSLVRELVTVISESSIDPFEHLTWK